MNYSSYEFKRNFYDEDLNLSKSMVTVIKFHDGSMIYLTKPGINYNYTLPPVHSPANLHILAISKSSSLFYPDIPYNYNGLVQIRSRTGLLQ